MELCGSGRARDGDEDDMQFTKMHGAGNDYVFVDCRSVPFCEDPVRVACEISDRHTGIGSDGLILMEHSEVADVRMRMFNADGSEGEMCGNGVRCIAKYLFDRQSVSGHRVQIESAAGLVVTEIVATDPLGLATRVRVTLGAPVLEARAIPTTLRGTPPLNVPVQTSRGEQSVSCVSLGNPHCVLFREAFDDDEIAVLGPELEHHAVFPQRINVGFCQIVDRDAVVLRVWERGSGETRACGSGACAAVVLGQLIGELAETVNVQLPGGALQVTWCRGEPVRLTGPAVEVFGGTWNAAKPGCSE